MNRSGPSGVPRAAPVTDTGRWHEAVALRLPLAVVAVSLACALLALMAERSQALARAASADHPLLAILLTPLAFAGLVAVARRWCPGALGGGVAQTLAALSLTPATVAPLLSFRVALAKIVLTAAALGAGASLGREGPGAQIGAALFRRCAPRSRRAGEQSARQWWLLGAAAGVAATFGTPLAGLVFVVEQLRGRLDKRGLLLAASAAGLAAALAQCLRPNLGVITPVALPDLTLMGAWAVLVCGVAGGVLGGAFARLLLAMAHHAGPCLRRWPVGCAAGLGLVVALLGSVTDGATLGPGLTEIDRWLQGEAQPAPGQTLAKMLATLASALAAVPGGLLSPSLAIGGSLGAELAPWLAETPTATMVVLGMIAYQAGVSRAPLTAVALVIELLGIPGLLPAALVTAGIANALSRQVCPQPLFEALAEGLARPLR